MSKDFLPDSKEIPATPASSCDQHRPLALQPPLRSRQRMESPHACSRSR